MLTHGLADDGSDPIVEAVQEIDIDEVDQHCVEAFLERAAYDWIRYCEHRPPSGLADHQFMALAFDAYRAACYAEHQRPVYMQAVPGHEFPCDFPIGSPLVYWATLVNES